MIGGAAWEGARLGAHQGDEAEEDYGQGQQGRRKVGLLQPEDEADGAVLVTQHLLGGRLPAPTYRVFPEYVLNLLRKTGVRLSDFIHGCSVHEINPSLHIARRAPRSRKCIFAILWCLSRCCV